MHSFIRNATVAAAILSWVQVSAFVTKPTTSHNVATELHAMPPMIIGPMIRKMRDEKNKANQPMATTDERQGQAPGLRVGGSAWKWPAVWPYDKDFFTPPEDIPKAPSSNQLGDMAGMLSGVAQVPTPAEAPVQEVEKMDLVKFWKDEKGNVLTELDEEAVEKLKG